MNNAVGVPTVVGMLPGVNVGLGTDGYTADAGAGQGAYIIHKHERRDPTVG